MVRKPLRRRYHRAISSVFNIVASVRLTDHSLSRERPPLPAYLTRGSLQSTRAFRPGPADAARRLQRRVGQRFANHICVCNRLPEPYLEIVERRLRRTVHPTHVRKTRLRDSKPLRDVIRTLG